MSFIFYFCLGAIIMLLWDIAGTLNDIKNKMK